MQTNYQDLFKKVDTKTPSAFLTEISDDTFFKATSQAAEVDPNATAAPTGAQTPAPAQNPAQNINTNPGGAGPMPNQQFANWNGQTNVKLNEILTGKVGLTVLDAVIPFLLVWALASFMDKKAKPSQFTTTAAEKSTLEPIIERCMASLNINFENPWIALAVSASAIYGSKFLAVATDENTPKIEKKPEMVAQTGGGVKKADGRGRPRKQAA